MMTSFAWFRRLSWLTLVAGSTAAPVVAQQGSAASNGEAAPAAVPAVNGKLRHIRLFESGANIPSQVDRAFQTKFEQARTRYINTELTFDFAAPGRPVDFKVECAYLNAADSVIGKLDFAFSVKPEWVNVLHNNGWGWASPGVWKTGTYRVRCSSDGVVVAETTFEIESGPAELPMVKGKFAQMRLYEAPAEGVAKADRKYAISFAANQVRYLHIEVELAHEPPGTDVRVPIHCMIIRGDGTIEASLDLSMGIQATFRNAYFARGWGRATPGYWKPGKYRAVCSAEGRLLDQVAFEVT
jgi:hypothetical protein